MSPSPSGPGFWTPASKRAGRETGLERTGSAPSPEFRSLHGVLALGAAGGKPQRPKASDLHQTGGERLGGNEKIYCRKSEIEIDLLHVTH
jgi:hypothetical protein